jgi:DNA invertase Pin-like site-specific DNA recombinase
MAKLRKDVAVIEQILEMRNRGEGFRSIARCLRVSRNTVKKVFREEHGKDYPEYNFIDTYPRWRCWLGDEHPAG